MPAILQNPPSGSSLMPYSVSPRRNDQMVVPNPRKNRSTFMPNSLAVAKWPPSCRKIATIRATTNSRTPNRLLIRSPGREQILDQCTGAAPCGSLRRQNRIQIEPGGWRMRREDLSDHLGDAGKRDAAGQERRHGFLVGGVHDRRGGPSLPPRTDREVEQREGGPVDRLELKRCDPCPVEPADRLVGAVRPAERQADRQAHVGHG